MTTPNIDYGELTLILTEYTIALNNISGRGDLEALKEGIDAYNKLWREIKSREASQLDERLNLWKADILAGFAPKCSFCGIKSRKVIGQLAKGKDAQENNHLPRNWGYYCQGCYDKGTELEREAMYGR